MSRAGGLRLLCLAAILVLAAVLRFWELPARGLIYWDEGKFLLEGIRLETGLRALAGAHVSMAGGKAIGTAKPTHALLMAATFTLLGVHDYAGLMMSAAFSVAGVALTYAVASELFDGTVGLLSALILAVSEYDVIYARSALSESDANTILLGAVLVWLVARKRPESRTWRSAPLLGAGALMGLALSTNYRLAVYVAAIVGFDLLWELRSRGWGRSLLRGLVWVIGVALVPILWEGVDLAARARGLVFFRSEITLRPSGYLQEALYQIHQGKQSVVSFGPLPYLRWYVAYEGWLIALLLALGIGLAVRYRSFPWLAALVPVGVPYLLYIWAPVIVPRNLAAAIPFASILAGAAAVTLARRLADRRLLLPALLLLATVPAADAGRRSWRLSAERSGFTRAAAYVLAHGDGKALTTSEITMFYLRGANRRCGAARVPHALPQVSADIRAGYAYAIMDHYSWVTARYIHAHMPRLAHFPATNTPAIGENLIAMENTHTPYGPEPVPYVSVFRLLPAGLPPPSGQPDVCDLNRV